MEKNVYVPNNGCLIISTLLWHVHSISPPFLLGVQPSVSNFEKRESEKCECLGGLKESQPQIFACGGILCFLSKTTLAIKWNMVFRAKFSNVNLGLFFEKKPIFCDFQAAVVLCTRGELFEWQLPVTTHRKVWTAILLYSGTLNLPLAYFMPYSLGGWYVITSYARDSVQTLLSSLKLVIQIILGHDTTITELKNMYLEAGVLKLMCYF